MITGNSEIKRNSSRVIIDDFIYKPFLFKDIQKSLLRLTRNRSKATDA